MDTLIMRDAEGKERKVSLDQLKAMLSQTKGKVEKETNSVTGGHPIPTVTLFFAATGEPITANESDIERLVATGKYLQHPPQGGEEKSAGGEEKKAAPAAPAAPPAPEKPSKPRGRPPAGTDIYDGIPVKDIKAVAGIMGVTFGARDDREQVVAKAEAAGITADQIRAEIEAAT